MNEDESAIRDVVERWMDASRRGDIDTVLDLMTDDVLFMKPGREPFGKAEFKVNSEALRDAKMDGRAEVREVEVLGDRAWIRNHIRVTMTPSGRTEPMTRSGYTLTILKRCADGQWRLFRDANLVS